MHVIVAIFTYNTSLASLPATHQLFADIVYAFRQAGTVCDGPTFLLLDPSSSRQTAYEPPHRPDAPPRPTSPPIISDRPSFAFIQRLIRASKWSGSSPSRGVRRSARLPKMTGIQKLLTQGAFDSHNWLLHSVCLSRAISARPVMYYIAWKTPSSVLLCGNKSRTYNFLPTEG